MGFKSLTVKKNYICINVIHNFVRTYHTIMIGKNHIFIKDQIYTRHFKKVHFCTTILNIQSIRILLILLLPCGGSCLNYF